MEEKKRFEKWSPLVPKVGQVVQIQLGGHGAFEASVMGRSTEDGETFTIWLDWPWADGKLILDITPNASARGMVDRANNVKPYWRLVPRGPFEKRIDAKLFFLD